MRANPSRRSAVPPALLALTIVLYATGSGDAALAESGPAGELVVPSSMCGPYFIIPIEVDGPDKGQRVTLQALFDTGGAQLSIDPGTVERLWGRKVSRGDPVKFRNASAGPMDFGTLRTRALSLSHLARLIGTEIDLFLPFREFNSMLLTLDYPRGEIRVARGRLPPPDGIEVFDARGPDKRPHLKVFIGGRERLLIVDSGASGSIYIRSDDSLGWESPPVNIHASQGMDSILFYDVGRLGEVVEIAGLPVWKPIVSLTDHTEVFGTKIMSRFAWTFDRRSRRLRAQLSSTVPLELESVRGTGAVRAPTDAGFEIVRVHPKTPAEEAGLRAGDLIVAEDGIPVYERGCARWDTSEQRDTVTLSVQRDDRSFDVTLSRVVLVP